MRRLTTLACALAALLSAGCYRVTVLSGAPAAATPAVNVMWAHGFVYGLVPPAQVNTASQCPQGVASVVTQQSFLNGLAQFLTWSLYSPQQITVTCATGPVRSAAIEAAPTQVAATPAPAPVAEAVAAAPAATKAAAKAPAKAPAKTPAKAPAKRRAP
jgi:hypothetical protein